MGYKEKVVVIGAGISGLACAYRLKQLGSSCLVLESQPRPGGIIATVRRNGFLFELGPQCPRFPAPLWRLVRELDLEPEFVAGDPRAKRFILHQQWLHPAPLSPAGLLKTRLVGLASKIRILTEALRTSNPPEREESLAEFVTRKFGAEVLDHLVDPIVSTVFFGDARKMGMESAFPALVEWERKYGSVARGALRTRNAKRNATAPHGSAAQAHENANSGSLKVTDNLPALGSFQSGMGRLPERLAEELRGMLRCGVRVAGVTPVAAPQGSTSAGWQIVASGGETIAAEHLVVALPAYEAARIVKSRFPQLAARLNAVEYAPIAVVSAAYENSQVANRLDGFGFMVPRQEKLKTICTFWNSSLFPQRTPENQVLITSFAGRDPADESNCAACEQRVLEENAKALGITGQPLDYESWNHAQALPQYNVGHAKRLREIEAELRKMPNLHLAGNYLKGRSIGECVEIAEGIAETVHGQLQHSSVAASAK